MCDVGADLSRMSTSLAKESGFGLGEGYFGLNFWISMQKFVAFIRLSVIFSMIVMLRELDFGKEQPWLKLAPFGLILDFEDQNSNSSLF